MWRESNAMRRNLRISAILTWALALAFSITALQVTTSQQADAAAPTYTLMDSSPTSTTPFIPNNYNSSSVSALELGIKVSTSIAGDISSVRFYKEPESSAAHEAHVWDPAGNLLATQPFTSESASGWQEVQLSTPIRMAANSTFIVSVFSSAYYYPGSTFATMTSGPLTVIGGMYIYNNTSAFPNNQVGYQYGVDFVFTPAPTVIPCSVSGSYQVLGTSVIWDGTPHHSCTGSITIPAFVTLIEPDAFYDDPGLTSVAFEAGSALQEIGYEAFYYDQNITDIALPSGLLKVGYNAFGFNSSLNALNIPSSVFSIGNVALSYLSKITSIILPTDLSIFDGIPLNGTPLTSATYCGSLAAVTTYFATTFPNINLQSSCLAQSITFTSTAPTAASVGSSPYSLTATGGAGGNAVIFASSTPSICSVSTNVVSFLSAGTCTVTANQSAHLSYSAAPQVQQSFSVSAALSSQTITFGALSSAAYDSATVSVSGTASSSLPRQ